jgi:hypothetical protein
VAAAEPADGEDVPKTGDLNKRGRDGLIEQVTQFLIILDETRRFA